MKVKDLKKIILRDGTELTLNDLHKDNSAFNYVFSNKKGEIFHYNPGTTWKVKEYHWKDGIISKTWRYN